MAARPTRPEPLPRAPRAALLVAALAAVSGCGGATSIGASGGDAPREAAPLEGTSGPAPAAPSSGAGPRPGAASPPDDDDEPEPPPAPRAGDSLSVLDDSRPRGELPRARIEAGIARGKPAMGACIARAAEEGPVEEARVVATFIIEPSGAVESAAFLVSTLTDDALSDCLLEALRAIRFDPPRGGIVMVSYPFQFRATGG